MAAAKLQFLAALVLSLFVSVSFALIRSPQLNEAQQCRIQRLTPTQPFQQLQSEGGVIERWNENDPQFQCVGVAPLRITVRPNSLSQPHFQPTPTLAYVAQGRGLFGMTIPGCAATYSSQSQQQQQYQQGQQGPQQFQQLGDDQHQRIHTVRKGDVLAIPSGAAHWCANDQNNDDLVVVIFHDLNHLANQLDQRLRAFFLAGGLPQQQQEQWGQQGESSFQNVLSGFEPQILSEAFNIPVEIAIKMQQQQGHILRMQQGVGIIRPDEQGQQGAPWEGQEQTTNGLEETICSMRVHANIDQSRQADVYSRQAGKLTVLDRHKLPLLRFMDMSIEKGDLFPNAIVTPHWTTNSHTVVYVVRGQAQVQVANYNGQNVMNDQVNEGHMVVVPQYFAATIRAGNNGCEYVALKTSGIPMKSPIAGSTSVIQAMPLQVLSNIFKISPMQAQQLKINRARETILLSPSNNPF